MSIGPSETDSTTVSDNKKRFKTFYPGSPSECVTRSEVLKHRRQKEADEAQNIVEKQQRMIEKKKELLHRVDYHRRQREKREKER